MKTPQTLHLRGVCPQYGVFTLNFMDENGRQPLHLAFRVSVGQIALNDNLAGQWGEEVLIENVEFPMGLPFEVVIELLGRKRLRVSMDGTVLGEFVWRLDIAEAARLDMVDVEFSLFRNDKEFKTLPENVTAADDSDYIDEDEYVEEPAGMPSAEGADQLTRYLRDLRADHLQGIERLEAQIGAISEELRALQKVSAGIAASVQALISLDMRTAESAQRPMALAKPGPAKTPAPKRPDVQLPPRGQVVEDRFVDGWGDWRHHQKVRLSDLGLFVVQQERSTPGLERKAIAVDPGSFYEFAVSGNFKVAEHKLFLAAYDPDNDLHLTPARYVQRESGTESQVFMTTGRTKRLILRVLVDNPKIGDECRLEHATLTLLGRADLYVPARVDNGETIEKICASMASVAGRDGMVVDAVHSLYPFVDKIRVYLNNYESVPEGLKLPRVEIVRSQQHGDNGDAGKFFWVEDKEFNLNLICDDDIIYPADYVPAMVAGLKRYGNKAIVGLHGILLKQPTPAYYNEQFRHVRRFVHHNNVDYQVHVLGTGCILYDARTLKLERRIFQYRNMADIWVMEQAQQQNIPAICIARPRNWLIQNKLPGGVANIYDASHGKQGNVFDTSALQSLRVKDSWPVTLQPTFDNGARRPKIVMSITTWNRVDYLKECIESFMRTRSPKYDWVLVVADDGSTDGTLAYLDQLVLPHEIHVIRNKGRFACGQTNTIFDLCQKIGFDFAFKIDDDILFKKRGWDTLYIDAAAASGYGHLCHRNWPHFTGLKRRNNPSYSPPAPHIDASGKCETIVGVWECDGCLFTFTPEMIEKVGYCDEANFPIRGQWHIDYSIRACRAGFNDPKHFYDARDSNAYIELQANKPTYRCSLPWGDAYKKTKEPAELERRERVMRDERRIYVAPLHAPAPLRRATKAAQFFDKVYVLNLDRRPDRLASIDAQMRRLGIPYERFAAIDGNLKPHIDGFNAYQRLPLVACPEGVRKLTRSKDFYQNYDSHVARIAYMEGQLKAKAIRTPGAWGYLKSYIAILEKALAAGHESFLILDDDAVFHRDFDAVFAAAATELPEDWAIFQLGALQYDWGDQWISKYSEHLYMCNGSSVGSHATGIRRSVAPALLHEAQRFDLPLDVGALCRVKRSHADKSFTVLPNLIIQDTSESDIASSDVQQGEGQKRTNVYRWKLEDYPGAIPEREPTRRVTRRVTSRAASSAPVAGTG
ncbi:MAG: glycosyltransferase [Alphaproteobacteria bacterium]|nr:glycosyltransferase [Alphaproteobacteria bacterium]